MFVPRTAWFIVRHGGGYSPDRTWRTTSFGGKVAALAVFALMGSIAAVMSIPFMAFGTYVLHQF